MPGSGVDFEPVSALGACTDDALVVGALGDEPAVGSDGTGLGAEGSVADDVAAPVTAAGVSAAG
jgi:hypothetical protein